MPSPSAFPRSVSWRRARRHPLVSPRLWRRRVGLFLGALCVAAAAVGFAKVADLATAWGHALLLAWLPAWLLLTPASLVLAVLATRHLVPGAQGSGVPQVIAALHLAEPAAAERLLALRVAGGKVLLTVLGMAGGAAVGREGPTAQVGAAIMNAIARRLGVANRKGFVLAGAAAGVAAAFNTPLAGVVFAIEELAHSYETRTSGAILAAVVTAGIATQAVIGNHTYFGTTTATLSVPAAVQAVPLCALAGGLLGGAFSQLLVQVAHGLPGPIGRAIGRRPLLVAAVAGLILGGLGLATRGLTYGTGYAEARALVTGVGEVPGWFWPVKLLATLVSYLSGIPGGIFAPSLAIGAGLGRMLAPLAPAAPLGAMVLLGMVGYFTGVVRAPLTAAVIVMEMSDNQALTIPLLATAFLAQGASGLVCRRPLYGALAARMVTAMTPH